MTEYINCENVYDYQTLEDWYINSIDNTISPVWTGEHIEELLNDFYIIPKDAPTVDVSPVKHNKWISLNNSSHKFCESCGVEFNIHTYEKNDYRFCPFCGANMDLEESE